MSILQWFLLILVIAVVAGAYWYLRRAADSDPWRGMEETEADDQANDEALARGESLGGDSYIVGVRTLSRETPAKRKAAAGGHPPPADEANGNGEPADDAADAPRQAAKPAPPDEVSPAERLDAGATAFPEAKPVGDNEPVAMRASRPPDEREIFILHVASPDGRFFDGPAIHAALAEQNLMFGRDDIYHRVSQSQGEAESVFAVANMLKPGTLDPGAQEQLRTPGLTLFLVVPGPLEGARAMRDMMATADALAAGLGGEVLDDKRALLKAQTAQYMLDQIAELDRRAQVASRR